ncbi:procathepsin L-like isoform X1 [Gigantopelta aegis]|uniref:procathepsin L-like isoform X1 n=1 Tax=Gigantopelta aegis TaxID=1735272 RepID=UPI001B88DC90|nr:procathepsin L-like isoform X1 [Gigantopelta aegis]
MIRIVVFTLIVALATALTKVEIDREWSIFKSMYNKVYTPQVEQKRRQIFEDNLAFIQKHNLQADRGVHSYRVGINEYADMTNQEFVTTMNGYRMRPEGQKSENPIYLKPSNVGDLPATVDWRTKGYVTEVKNQGSCGSCWAFSTTGSLEGQHFKKTGKLVSLSEQNLVDCSRKQGNMGCEGGLMDQAFTYIKVNHGIDTEISYPYEGINGKCRFKPADVGANDTGFVDVKSGSESDLQSAVATVGPVSVAIDASHISFQLYKSGVYHSFLCSSKKLDHGVLAVGYGTLSGKDYWLVKNSWGGTWGDKGYIMMSRNSKNNCGIATAASYPTV